MNPLKREEVIALVNSDPPLTLDDYSYLTQTISREFRWYLIGLTCIHAEKKSFHTNNLNQLLTLEQVAINSGYSHNTMKRFVSYTNSIFRLQIAMPKLADAIIMGNTRLGLKTTIILSKLPPKDIDAVMKRVEDERTPIRKIIAEQIKRPVSYPRRFSDGRGTKSSPKSVKDIPRYDPDAQVTVLTYTIPSWKKAMDRIHMNQALHTVSQPTRMKLDMELTNLRCVTEALIERMTEARK